MKIIELLVEFLLMTTVGHLKTYIGSHIQPTCLEK